MKDLVAPAIEGFVGSFMLAGVIVAAVASGAWRVTSRLYDAFVHHKPLLISPGHEVEVP
jgi:hypothetical protein